jgi:catalase
MSTPQPLSHARLIGLAVALAFSGPVVAVDPAPAHETPLDLVNALHSAFGEHHARAVHTKGVMFEGTFTPAPGARALTKAPIFTGGAQPVIARFSDFAGVPTLPDTDDGAAPAGFAVKIKAANGTDYDLENNNHNTFIVATSDEFAVFLRAVGAAGKGDTAPLTAFLGAHPEARAFLGSLTYPASYATATYFGVNAFKFTDAKGHGLFVRYRYVPRAGDHYLSPAERKAQGPDYLQQEILKRVAGQPIVFDWYAQIAEKGDKIEDPSIAWPESRKLVKLGTFTLTRQPDDLATLDRTTLFLPGQPHPGIDPADPMLILRNTAYPISLGQRQ